MLKGVLSNKEREQIAVGVSVVAKCQPCLQYHLKEARKIGVSNTEIEEIIKLARQIRSVSEQKMDEFVGVALNSRDNTQAVTGEAEGCCPSAEEQKKEKVEADCC